MPLKHRKQIFQIYVTDLKIPTGSSQTSWLFTKSDRGFELGGGLEPGTSELQHQHPKPLRHAASLTTEKK